jgi:hypothetical protein
MFFGEILRILQPEVPGAFEEFGVRLAQFVGLFPSHAILGFE